MILELNNRVKASKKHTPPNRVAREKANKNQKKSKLFREGYITRPNVTLDISQNYYGTNDINKSNIGMRNTGLNNSGVK